MSVFYCSGLLLVMICFGQCQKDSILFTYGSEHYMRIFNLNGSFSTVYGTKGVSGYIDGVAGVAKFNYPGRGIITPSNTSLMLFDSSLVLRKLNLKTGSVSSYAGAFHYSVSIDSDSIDGDGISATFAPIKAVYYSNTLKGFYVSTNAPAVRFVTFPLAVVSTILGSSYNRMGNTDGIIGGSGRAPGSAPYYPSLDESFFIVTSTSYRNVKRLNVATLQMTTLAGRSGMTSPSGCTDGIGSNALFSTPTKVLFSESGNDIYIADPGSYSIRVLNLLTTTVSTLVGTCPTVSPTVADGVGVGFYVIDIIMSSDKKNIYATQYTFPGLRKVEISTRLVSTIGASVLPTTLGPIWMVLMPVIPVFPTCRLGEYYWDNEPLCISCPAGYYCLSATLPPTKCTPGTAAAFCFPQILIFPK